MKNIISRSDNHFVLIEYLIKKWYTTCIIQQPSISNYSEKNQRDLVLDTAENLTQIGEWTKECFTTEQVRIELFLGLTRKNVNALMTFPLPPTFASEFAKFCAQYELLENEYKSGLSDRNKWAASIMKLADTLNVYAK